MRVGEKEAGNGSCQAQASHNQRRFQQLRHGRLGPLRRSNSVRPGLLHVWRSRRCLHGWDAKRRPNDLLSFRKGMLPSAIPKSHSGRRKAHSGIPVTHSREWNPPSARRNCFDGMGIPDSVDQDLVNRMTFPASIDQILINAMTFPDSGGQTSPKQKTRDCSRAFAASGTEGGTRTPTLLRAVDFESTASTIPPLRHGRGL